MQNAKQHIFIDIQADKFLVASSIGFFALFFFESPFISYTIVVCDIVLEHYHNTLDL